MLNTFFSSFSVQFSASSRRIKPGRSRTLRVIFHPSYPGRYEDTLELVFWDPIERVHFVIHRRLLATVGDRNDHEQLKASAPYTRRKRIPLRIDGPIRRSLRPPTWTKTKWVGALPKFDMPRQITDTLYKRGAKSRKDTLALVRQIMPPDFTSKTYGSHFQVLLYLEEEQMK